MTKKQKYLGGSKVNAVLLLNASCEPLNVISIKRAFKLWSLGKAIFLEESDVSWNSAKSTFKVPLIARLVDMCDYRKYIQPRLARRNIYVRDNFTCQYCDDRHKVESLTIDHVHPRKHGGQTTWGNVVTCCKTCNQKKADLTLKEAEEILGMELINGKPKKPSNMLLTTRLKHGYNLPECWMPYMY